MVSRSAPKAPQAAPSVGVAKPKMMLPRAAKTRAAGGTRPLMNSIQAALRSVARSSSGSIGARDGFKRQRIMV